MPICPKCKTENDRRGRGGVCPNCGVSVTLYDGGWFITGEDSPVNTFIKKYEQLYSLYITKGKQSNAWKIPKTKVAREMAQAKRIISEICGGDLELALKSLEILFTDKRWSYRNYSTLLFTINDLYSSKVVAEELLNREKKKEEEENKSIARMDWRQEVLGW